MEMKELQPLFEYMDEKFAKIDERFEHIEKKVDGIQTSVDNLTKMVKDFHEEIIVTRRRLDVLEAWAKKVSEKIGIPLPY